MAIQNINRLMLPSGIGPLTNGGVWSNGDGHKAQMFATCFESKFALPNAEENEYSAIQPVLDNMTPSYGKPADAMMLALLNMLKSDSATGPDDVPTKFLRACVNLLCVPFQILCELILHTCVWLQSWRSHRLTPLHKRGSSADSDNYQASHITSQISKVIERALKHCFAPILCRPII